MTMFAVNATGAETFRKLQREERNQQTEILFQAMEKGGMNKEPPEMVSRTQHADLTICPTFRCNLACQYCFARGGNRIDNLSIEAAKAAVDLALTRYSSGKIANKTRLTWHGGGEPSLALPLVKEVSLYHKERALKIGFEPQISIVSNGLWSEDFFEWLTKESVKISISCDGPADIQDLQRPLSNGGQSSPLVYKTLRRLTENGVEFGIRSTITEHNVCRMPEMVEFFHNICKPKTLQFERLAVCGRCEETRIRAGSAEAYVEHFKKAFDLAQHFGINLTCSGVSVFRRTLNFCGAAGRTLCVMPNGLLTTCHRVDNLADPLASEFVFGSWQNARYCWDQPQLEQLSEKLNVERLNWCKDCFCKYTCAGGCAAARFTDIGNLQGSQSDERCFIIRELTRHRLVSLAKARGLFNQIH